VNKPISIYFLTCTITVRATWQLNLLKELDMEVIIEMELIQTMAEHFKLLGDKSRLTILALLREKELCVCDIVEILQMSQPSISQHLRKLKDAGLVTETRKKQWIYYSLNIEDKPHIQAALEHIPSLKAKLDELENNQDRCC
jgi:ArsR family transcriptional regulator, arsenate/arsenite/antimonite-responsive transcriptional repressor